MDSDDARAGSSSSHPPRRRPTAPAWAPFTRSGKGVDLAELPSPSGEPSWGHQRVELRPVGALPWQLAGTYLHVSSEALAEGEERALVQGLVVSQGRATALGRLHIPRAEGCATAPSACLAFDGRRILALGRDALPVEVDPDLREYRPATFDREIRATTDKAVRLADARELHLATASGMLQRYCVDDDGAVQIDTFDDCHAEHLLDIATTTGLLLVALRTPDRVGVRVVCLAGTVPVLQWDAAYAHCDAVSLINLSATVGEIILDVIETKDTASTAARWTLDRRSGALRHRSPFGHHADFAAIDPRLVGKAHRYLCVANNTRMANLGGARLSVLDPTLEQSRTYELGFGRVVATPVIAPCSPTSDEFRGWLLVLVYDGVQDRSELVVWDLARFPRSPTLIPLPTAMPRPGTGLWLPAEVGDARPVGRTRQTPWGRGTSSSPEGDQFSMGTLAKRAARRWPHAAAVGDGHDELSYSQLNTCVESWARRLARLGATRGTRIAIFGDKRVHTVVAILAASRAGATYVPLDATLPATRRNWLLDDVRPSIVITHTDDHLALKAGVNRLALEDFGRPPQEAELASELPTTRHDDVAYIMYTSGSSGWPKGVMISHGAIEAFFQAHARAAHLGPDARCMNTGPFHFDVSVLDVFLPLHLGAFVRLTPERPVRSQLLQTLERERISHFYAVGTILGLMTGDGSPLDSFDLTALRTLQTGAEVCNVATVNRWLERVPNLRFVNSYGPTELTVGCMNYAVPHDGPLTDPDCPIGSPHAGSRVLVVDQHGTEVTQPDVVGELWVGGAQIMTGYWQREAASSHALVERNGTRYYRTGDLVRRDKHGLFRYRGRCDDEIKIAGRRIHPNEIRRCATSVGGVASAVCGVFSDPAGRRHLGLAVTFAETSKAIPAENVLKHIEHELGAALTPRAVLVCDKLPRLPSGKSDVRRCMDALQSALATHPARVVSLCPE